MTRHHYYHRIQHPYLGFISRLDLELLISGFSTEITRSGAFTCPSKAISACNTLTRNTRSSRTIFT